MFYHPFVINHASLKHVESCEVQANYRVLDDA